MRTVALEADQRDQLAETFGLLADPTRLSIIMVCADEAVAVGEIAERLGLTPSLVSHHLRLLRAARILRAERRGKHIFYALADECVRDVLHRMINHLFVHAHEDEEAAKTGEL